MAGLTVSAAVGSASFRPLDLSRFYNSGVSNAQPEVVRFLEGTQTLDSVPYILEGKVMLTGMDSARNNAFLAPQIQGIQVGQRVACIHVLHGALHVTKDGIPLANLVLHYKDGSVRRLRLVFGIHARNSIEESKTPYSGLVDPNSNLAWEKEFKGSTNLTGRIFHTVLENPLPEKEISSLDVESLFSRAAPVLFAVTLQAKGSSPLKPLPNRKVVQRGWQFDDSIYRHSLTLRVTGPSLGTSVSNATATVMIQDDSRAFFFGQYRADAAGEIRLAFPPQETVAMSVRVSSPGLVPESLVLSSSESGKWPEFLDVPLKKGEAIGGLVVDSAGKPVPGASVIPYQIRQTGLNEFTRTDLDRLTTAPDGKWLGAATTQSLAGLQFEIAHPDYRSANGQFSVPDLLVKNAKTVLEPHPRVAGRVLSDGGKPVANAAVILDLTSGHLVNYTDENGRYSFVVRDLTNSAAALIAIATNYAPAYQKVVLRGSDSAPDLVVEQGSRFSMVMLDQARKPIPGVKVRLEEWEGSKAMQWENQTDSRGRFSWDHAPNGSVTFQYQKPGFMTQTHSMTLPLAGETTFTYSRRTTVAGRVVDADTQKPVDNFKARIQYKYKNGSGSSSTTGRKGSFSYNLGTYNEIDEVNVILEARGYEPVSKVMTANETGSYSNLIELNKAVPILATIVAPDGKPVSGAEVVLLDASSNATMDERGRFSRGSSMYDMAVSDLNGRVELTPKLNPDVVLASHKTFGFAQVPASNVLTGAKVVLQPWGRVQGVLRVVDKIEPFHFVALTSSYNYRANGRSSMPLYVHFKVKPEQDGRFVFTNVPPGERLVSLRYQFKEKETGTTHLSHTTPVAVKAGETNEVVIGGGGRMVTGKAVFSGPNAAQVDWTLYAQTLRPQFRPQPSFLPRLRSANTTPEERQRSLQEQAEANRLAAERESNRINNIVYALVFEQDGKFYVPDLPPGSYSLYLAATIPRATGSYTQVGYLTQQVTVPEGKGPFDLGTFQVKSYNNNF